ncbi:unnamed protein product [Triticum turgidum subsp. durum]|uniref:Uncharacterized protein n=1 Tax=Triticum turgidum subsp. durum TaxID=4567 RepID=A0A9R0ZY15_TRITD|nr:unnamed protein product [Triticum turgidum subsp. durum]
MSCRLPHYLCLAVSLDEDAYEVETHSAKHHMQVIVRYRNFTLNLSLQVDQRVDRCRREDRAGGWNRRQWTILTLENGRISIGGSLFTWTMLGIFCGPSSLQNNAQSNLNSGHDSLKLLFSTLKKQFTRISGHALRKIAREYEEIFLE